MCWMISFINTDNFEKHKTKVVQAVDDMLAYNILELPN
jgi:hypothetical protein